MLLKFSDFLDGVTPLVQERGDHKKELGSERDEDDDNQFYFLKHQKISIILEARI